MMPVTDEEYDGPISMAATQSTMSKAEQRKSNKPIMEKRRRARINHCLNELKTLILNAMKKDPARHSKLEKADILEMTVKHLQTVQRGQLPNNSGIGSGADPAVITRFRSGFDECAAEVNRYIGRLEGVDHGVKQRLSAHLTRCVGSLQQIIPPSYPGHDDNNNSNQRVQLVPSRLMSGEMALVLPNSSNFLSPNGTSAFKPPTSPKAFQPFQVDLPNTHLKAHISIPETFERYDRPRPNSSLKLKPNYKLYPKLSPQNFNYSSNEVCEPPMKMRRHDSPPTKSPSPTKWEPRISVIVRDHAKGENGVSLNADVKNNMERVNSPDLSAHGPSVSRDMWRPW